LTIITTLHRKSQAGIKRAKSSFVYIKLKLKSFRELKNKGKLESPRDKALKK